MKDNAGQTPQATTPVAEAIEFMAAALSSKQPKILQMAIKAGFSVWEAKDIYQDVCVACIEKVQTTRIEIAVAYVQTVARNLIADACENRNLNSQREMYLDEETLERCADKISAASSSPEDDHLDRAIRRAQARAIFERELSPAVREVIQLSLIEGLDDDEIAQYLKIKPATVRQRRSRGLAKLRLHSSKN